MARMKGQGRKPKPTVLKLLHGTARKHRINPREPKPKVGEMLPPEHLSPLAREHWITVEEQLRSAGILTTLDRPALEVLCEVYARWCLANEEIKKTGILIRGESGGFVKSPYLFVSSKSFDQMLKMLTEFGMTPSARTRVNAIGGNEPDNEFEKFLNEK